jgi:hypothetical protein
VSRCLPSEVIYELFKVPWEERDQLGFPMGARNEPLLETALDNTSVLDELIREVSKRLALVKGQCLACGCQNGTARPNRNGKPSQRVEKRKT